MRNSAWAAVAGFAMFWPGHSVAQDIRAHESHGMGMPAPEQPKLLRGYGNGGFPIATASPEAQAYFSNGMELAFAFEHRAARSAMEEAARLDPQCVMCAWGAAWVNGPTINFHIESEELAKARSLAATADKLARDHGTALERQMTGAIVERYRKGGGGGQPGDKAFARAMARVAHANPEQDSLQTIAADAALIELADDASDRESTRQAILAMSFLTPVLGRNPDDTPAIHFYIHSSEIAGVPAYAEPYADRLGRLAPNAQHLVHMPSHTFYWVGRYRDAGLANRRAVEIGYANAAAAGLPPKGGPFTVMYHSHNVHFGLGGAMLAGDRETALAIARPLVAAATDPGVDPKDNPVNKMVGGVGLIALGLFAPDEVLSGFPPKSETLSSYWHYARGEAFIARGDAAAAKAEAAAMQVPAIDRKAKDDDGGWILATILTIAQNVIAGKAAILERRYPDAIVAFERAVTLEEAPDFSRMSDPPFWWYPVRRSLAEARLDSGDRVGARADALATLKRRPNEPGTLSLLGRIEGRTQAAQ